MLISNVVLAVSFDINSNLPAQKAKDQ